VLLAVEVAQLHHARQDADGMERAATQLTERLAAFDAGAEPDAQAIAALAASQLSGLPTAIPLARAMTLKEAGRMDEAAPFFAQALAATGQSTDEQRDLHEASVLGSQERWAEALEAYGRYAAVRDGQSGFVAALARFLGPEQVARSRRQSLEQDLAFFTRVKAWAQARAAADELDQAAGPDWWQADERPWAILSDLGEVAEGLGELERALNHYERAFDVYEARRGLLASEGLRTALGASKDVQWLGVLAARCALRLAETGDASARARAFAFAERGKARVLLDLMARSAARTAGRLDEPEARRRWRELGARADVSAQLLSRRRAANAGAAEVAALEQRLGADQAALRTVEEELARTDPAWLGGMRATGEVAPLEEVAAAVPAGAALLQWVFLGRNLLTWAITRDGLVSYTRRELDSRALGRAIRELRAACEGRSPAWEAHAAALAGPLLEPFAGVLADHERVIFVPYGVAHELPLHVLPFEGAPLATTHTVSTLPSASVLPHLGAGTARPWRVLAVGNPARMSHRAPGASRAEPAPPLRGAEAEAELAAAAFADGVALTGDAATEPAVRRLLGDFPVLHLATHGILDQDAPGMSSVLLADGEELSVYELAGLELDIDLAVLSACRTGQGEATRGDDVVGLARGLLGAGCRAAVVSLWPVDDASTTLLMAAFYRELQGGAAPADALRASALHVRGLSRADAAAELAELRTAVPEGARDILGLRRADAAAGYDHPYHWAPFALVGTGLTGKDTT
jgi:CHAT domain-containing protein